MTISSFLPINEVELQALKERFEKNGQGHVFHFFDELEMEQQAQLIYQLLDLDVERLNEIYKTAIKGAEASVLNSNTTFEPLPEAVFDSVLKSSPEQIRDWETLGLSLIAQGKVAVILMAGGQGTRLGSSDPKGCYNINLPSKKSLFQLQAERILRLQDIARQYQRPSQLKDCVIPWYIMTSGPTHAPTYQFFEANHFFGLKKENIIFFEQGTLPCLTMDGKIILEAKDKVAIAPDGNGGIYAAVQNKGVIKSLKERGILYSHCYCVDNCLARVADPVFIGYSVSKGTDCGVKVVSKVAPEEPVGVVCVRDGKYSVVEYSEISQEVSERRTADGASLLFGAANIANHFFSTEFLERVPQFASQLEYHIAKKKIKYVDMSTGEVVVPKSNSGMKLECFVFDVFPFANHFSVLEVDRKDEFSPLKNAPGTGADCPETSRRDIVAQHVRFIEAAGGQVEQDGNFEELEFELSPWVSYAGEGLADFVAGKIIKTPAIIETKEDLIRSLN
ncbi:nucleotide-diphospho-sugar transferase [Cokeromyces recurvatus]|uniref:nucleotide-diphospho-sugar transferase n=1 Tax=Cokeromyces recurvatus TaxID=90255 RepID=UPI00221F168E|nr:nucleotide-diphospho-sugar transferase [Cokeromyces recurvatus]KAI7902984.1 nucleotide-diphospho-sugar transferase [Cokeromyces recurvatus]